MSNKKITELTETTSLSNTDLITVVTDLLTTPTNKKITRQNFAADLATVLNALYVKLTGDTMTGNLTLPTLYATSTGSSEFSGDVILKSGQKLIFDGV